jgi:MEDS: MEthanogen/methylotroph, DcmR Sensory domain
MHEGLSRGARCLFVGTHEDYDQLRTDLELLGICSRKAIARSALTFATPEEIYFDRGVFDGDRTLARYDQQIDRALAEGFVGLRTTAELHMLPDDTEWRRIVQYEAQVNEHFARRPVSGLCRYATSLVSPDRVRDVLRTHPVAVLRGEGCDNPFYERPELVLSDDSRTRLDWQFRQLRVQHRARLHLEGTRESAVAAAAELAAELHQLRSHLAKSKPD